MLLRKVLSVVGNNPSATAEQIAKEVTVLDACRWIKKASSEVKAETVTKCFSACGFSASAPELIDEFDEEDDIVLARLVNSVSIALNIPESPTVSDYTSIDNNVNTSEELSDLEFLTNDDGASEVADDGSDCEDDNAPPTVTLELKTYADAVHYAQQLKLFCLEKNMPKLFEHFAEGEDELRNKEVSIKCVSKQSALSDYFQAR